MKHQYLVPCSIVAALTGLGAPRPATRPSTTVADDELDAVLDTFHHAAEASDFNAYFGCFAPNAVFLGTDPAERWTVDELREFVRPHFPDRPQRTREVRERHIMLCPGATVACFDELVEIETYGLCRGTGVLVNLEGAWLIKQYSLSLPIPNESFFAVVDLVAGRSAAGEAMPADVAKEVRAALDTYVAAARFPDPAPVDETLYAPDIESFWSNGAVYRGRAAMVAGLEQARQEIAADFESVDVRAKDVRVRLRGDVAWVSCRILMDGTLSDDRGPIDSTVRSTFVFERQGGRWSMVQEHSALVTR